MLRAFYISLTVLCIVFFLFCLIRIDEVHSARWNSYNYYSYDSYRYNSYNYDSYDSSSDLTQSGAIISLIFFLAMVAVYVLTLIRLRSKTMKVLSIIGLSLTGICMALAGFMMGDPGSASFDEVGPMFVIYSAIMLGFSIVGIVHAFRFEGKKTGMPVEADGGREGF